VGDGICEVGSLMTDIRDELHKLVWDIRRGVGMGGCCVNRMIKSVANDIECGIGEARHRQFHFGI
jgi:hypothetical protein